ncbi:ty3-gypsy retrotransposon protein [Tanacetum coccineum]
MPTMVTTQPTSKPLAIKWISPAERQERLNKGLCFNCDNKWARGHKCPGKFLLLMTDEGDDSCQEPNTEEEEAVESGDIFILNSLIGQGSPRSSQLWGKIGIDARFNNGVDLYVLPMHGLDVVLGMQWLQKLGKVTHDYAQQTMEYTLATTTYVLKGDASLRMKRISLHQMQALWDAEDVYGVYEFHSLPLEAKDHGASEPRQPALETLLSRVAGLFQVPTVLPPHRLIDHQEMEKLVKEMMSQGIIRFSHSPFCSPVLLVKKKDGSYRFCVDYRALNAVTVKDKFLIPTADEMFDELGGAHIFSKLDLRAGYHQICVHQRDVYKTAFRTHDGHYEFLCLQEHKFFVKQSKCVFGAATLEYLGHIILGHGVEMDPKKVAAVREWPVPTSQRHVRGFLGIAGYYSRHIGEERVQQARLQTLKSIIFFEDVANKRTSQIVPFTAKLTTLVNKAASLGHTIKDSAVVRELLNAVPDKFLQIVVSIEQYSDFDEMSVEEAIGRLKTFKERIKAKKGKAFEDQDKLLFVKHNDNGRRHHYDDQKEEDNSTHSR